MGGWQILAAGINKLLLARLVMTAMRCCALGRLILGATTRYGVCTGQDAITHSHKTLQQNCGLMQLRASTWRYISGAKFSVCLHYHMLSAGRNQSPKFVNRFSLARGGSVHRLMRPLRAFAILTAAGGWHVEHSTGSGNVGFESPILESAV